MSYESAEVSRVKHRSKFFSRITGNGDSREIAEKINKQYNCEHEYACLSAPHLVPVTEGISVLLAFLLLV
jgi:hypothetical protein